MASLLSQRPTISQFWGLCQQIPGGRRIFSRSLGRLAPYTGTIDCLVEELRAGHSVDQPPTAQQLSEAQRRSGLPLRAFFNTSGQSYREGGFSARLPTMDEAAQFAALAADGKLN